MLDSMLKNWHSESRKMQKKEYLSNKNVCGFVSWMSDNLESNAFAHEYWNRKKSKLWSCTSLYNALEGYEWPFPSIVRLEIPAGFSFENNSTALSVLKSNLLESLNAKDDDGFYLAAIDVMTWGGVRNGNVAWLTKNKIDITQLILNARDAFNLGCIENSVISLPTFRFNSGMTKVYSLICDNFIIYDSRVAAALEWAVVLYAKNQSFQVIPEELQFPHAPSRNGIHKRNANFNSMMFPSLRPGPHHAAWNLKASWLLDAVLKNSRPQKSKFSNYGENSLRALEAALFMLGYDLIQND